MHRFVINKSIDVVTNCISNSMTHCKKNPTIFKTNISMNEEFVGGVTGRIFWIQKTIPKIFNIPSRTFFGELNEIDSNRTVIAGKFKFARFYRVSVAIFCIVQNLIVVCNYLRYNSFSNKLLYIVMGINLCYFALYHLNVLLCRKEEKSVINLLLSINEKNV